MIMTRLSQVAFTLRPKVAQMWLSQFHAGGGGTGRDHMIPCSRLRSCWLTPAFPTHWIKSHTGFPTLQVQMRPSFSLDGFAICPCRILLFVVWVALQSSNNNIKLIKQQQQQIVCLFVCRVTWEFFFNFVSWYWPSQKTKGSNVLCFTLAFC